ncbi:MAG: hypothetical protein IKE59_03650 [Erysipelotrichaceae bacterium]|nr:hypothetical protein [Erysipelotrichaceae bacterium]
MYILILALLAVIVGAILKIAWPLIVAVAVFLFVCFLLSILKERQDARKREENIIRNAYEEREDEEHDPQS